MTIPSNSTSTRPVTDSTVSMIDHVLMGLTHGHAEVLLDEPETGVVDVGEEQRARTDREHDQ